MRWPHGDARTGVVVTSDDVSGVINPLELAAYEYILFERDWSLESLSEHLGGDVAQSQAVVEGLVRRRLLRQTQEDGATLVAVSPAVGMGAIVGLADASLKEQAEYVHGLRTMTTSLLERFERERAKEAHRALEMLVGRDAVARRIGELLVNARCEVLTIVTAQPSAVAIEQSRQGDLRLLARGIKARGIYLDSHRRQSLELRRHLRWLRDHGAEVRVTPVLPLRFMVVDRTVAVVALRPDDPAAGGVLVHTPGLVELAATLFDHLWQAASDPDPRPRPEADGVPHVTELELAVLTLLAQGNKDETVGRRTGMSVRSVRRIVASLSEQVGANSRFELGLRCRDLGLI